MPRKPNKGYYAHDDRTGSSPHNIRKVSFMNGSGRIRKPKRPDNTVVKYVGDDDVEMGGVCWQNWKGPKGRKNFRGRPASPVLRNPRRHAGWYQVRIHYGAKYGRPCILQLLVKYLSPRAFNPVCYTLSGKDAVFYVEDQEVAAILRNASKKIVLNDGYKMELRVRDGLAPPIQIDEKSKDLIKLVMAKRYIAENKALDLSGFAFSPEFMEEGVYWPLSRPSILKLIWQIISENISDLVALNLTNNRIGTLDESMTVDIKKLKNLKILHLGGNRISSIISLNCFRDLEVTELVLKNNPLVNMYKDNTHYVSDVRKKFPKLTKLDDIELPPVISFDVGDEGKLPPPQASFMCNPEGRLIVKEFLTQYYALYDSDNRLDLMQAYHDNSSFSMCVFYPQNQKASSNKLQNYLLESRNLFRIFDFPRRKNRLRMGKQNIVQFLSQLPKSQHDLSSFVVDLTLYTPALLNLSVNGVFRETSVSQPARTWPVRHFTRTFLIVPVNQGFCIMNEILSITNATEEEVECSFKETQSTAILQSPPSAPRVPELNLVTSALQSVQLDESVQLQMVQTLASRTGMNLEWSKKCLDETQWNFDRAIWTFSELQSKGTIPAEAFVK